MTSLLTNHSCTASTFSTPTLFGAEILSVDTNLVTNYNFPVSADWRYTQPSVNVQNATFCNVTVTYTHPGLNDTINVETWLPVNDWNDRLYAPGGSGWTAGRFILQYAAMAAAIQEGYATVTTDSGLGTPLSSEWTSLSQDWVVISPGNLNLVAFDDLGHVTLNDAATIAKDLIKSYYGHGPSYSYWNGCSQGGRQASILAQQYPTVYDGIIAAAPALYWAELMTSSAWAAFYMDSTKQYPRACELTKLTSLAISACDELDGVKDGLIAETEECRKNFSASDYIGTNFECADTNTTMAISAAAAAVAESMWDGPRFSNGDFMWYGFEIGADLASIAPTTCNRSGQQCVPTGREAFLQLYQGFILRDTSANITEVSPEEFDYMFRTLKRIFSSSMAATDPNLADFKNAGGKMMTFHGLADNAITPASTLSYYKQVSHLDNTTSDFFRYYQVPGLEHCFGGAGGQPTSMFEQLRQWVENGTAPESSPVMIKQSGNATRAEIICPYPKKAVFEKNNCTSEDSSDKCWKCK
ncbi:tannase and feruloyl esterase [Daldinia caldariorum]|uniref:tannase and feruloyl esterase n=1 Tax=Daldinia caldariorum TaxID=326644 RepID=UPI0020083E98|nr:tannase and feruloyl esterase [Daldinia caldariorum]KAI1471262.1 tannase and feruloyl esterase [Daldinia caldariorum]